MNYNRLDFEHFEYVSKSPRLQVRRLEGHLVLKYADCQALEMSNRCSVGGLRVFTLVCRSTIAEYLRWCRRKAGV